MLEQFLLVLQKLQVQGVTNKRHYAP